MISLVPVWCRVMNIDSKPSKDEVKARASLWWYVWLYDSPAQCKPGRGKLYDGILPLREKAIVRPERTAAGNAQIEIVRTVLKTVDIIRFICYIRKHQKQEE
jgi:hypothetical protein